MPTLAYELALTDVLTERETRMVRCLLEELNVLRDLSVPRLPPLTLEDFTARCRDDLHNHPPTGQGG